jgi:serine/threonine protein kinase
MGMNPFFPEVRPTGPKGKKGGVEMGTRLDRPLAGRYRLGEALGRGGMAEVIDGFDERLQRPVAVKVLRPEMAANADIRRRFEAEARNAARLSHPNVVAVFDTGEDGGLPFIVMERLPGETLADRMAAGRIDPDRLRGVALDILGALTAAHESGIIHRDIKPGNVLLSADGRAKVADFGISKAEEAVDSHGRAETDTTATNILLGTPAYVAPERLEGAPATPRSDLYSVGVLLFEALAGAKPSAGATLPPGVPADLAASTRRAMAPNPADRFASASAMAAALGGDRSDATLILPVAPPGGGRRRTWARSTTRALAAFGAGLVAVTLIALVGHRSSSAKPAPSPPTSTAVAPTTTPPTTAARITVRTTPAVDLRKHKKHGGND